MSTAPSQAEPAAAAKADEAKRADAHGREQGGGGSPPGPVGLLGLQGAVGNRVVSRLVQRGGDPPAAPAAAPAPAPAPGASPDANQAEKELLEKEDKAVAALQGVKGAAGGTFVYGNPLSPKYQPPEAPPSATVTIGDLVLKPTTDTDKRRTFDSEAQARAFASFNKGPAGAVVVKSGQFFAAATLSSASDSELTQPNVYRFTAGANVVCAIGADGFVFTTRDYTPNSSQAGERDRPEKDLAAPVSADELRKLAGMRPEGPDPGAGATKAGMKIPAGQEESFITSYLRSRALESLEQNRKEADGLASDFKPGKDGKLSQNATDLIGKSRALGEIYQKLEDDERKVGEQAVVLQEKHYEGKWNWITIGGVKKKYHQWLDELNAKIKAINEGKENTLALSPMLASMVRHDKTPQNAKEWASKLGWENSSLSKAIDRDPVLGGIRKLWNAAEESSKGGETWNESELSKQSSEESDKKVAEQFRTKLDSVQKAISRTYGKVTAGDTDYLLGMGGLRSRVSGDIGRLGPENQAVKDKWKEMCESHDMVEELIDIAGTVVQIGALFLPGGQFISAAIGMGLQMHTMSKHLDQIDASQAAVDPTKALVDQQELAQKLLFDTLNIAIQAVDLATSFNSVLGDLEAGRMPKASEAGSEAKDPASKHVGDKDLPAAPLKPGEAPKVGGSMSHEFADLLEKHGIPMGNPYTGINAAAVHKACGKDWKKVKNIFIESAKNEGDKMAGSYVMHQMTAYRQSVTKGKLDSICARLTKETGVVHEAEAVGSTALTSDLDFSIKGPRAGEAAKEFNAQFRAEFGVESGVAFDSNVYTRSAHLDYPLTPKPGDAKIPLDAKGMEEWNSFKNKALGEAKEAEKARLQKVVEQAEKDFPDDLRARLRAVDNFKQQSASHVRAYENAMSHGAEGPTLWKQYCDQQLTGLTGAQRAAVQSELEQAASQAVKGQEEVLEQLRKAYPNETWTPERLQKMAHSDDPVELDKFMKIRNGLYEGKLAELDKLKEAYEKAGTEAERIKLAAEINNLQTDTLYFASEAYQTQGSILGVVQNAQKAGGDITSLHYGELVSNQARAAFNEQIGNAMAYGAGWPEVTKAGKYLGRAEKAMMAHPMNPNNLQAFGADLRGAMESLEKLKSLPESAPELKNWASKFYPDAPDLGAALKAHRGKLKAVETAMSGQMNKNLAKLLEPGVWEAIAKDPSRLSAILKALEQVAHAYQEP